MKPQDWFLLLTALTNLNYRFGKSAEREQEKRNPKQALTAQALRDSRMSRRLTSDCSPQSYHRCKIKLEVVKMDLAIWIIAIAGFVISIAALVLNIKNFRDK